MKKKFLLHIITLVMLIACCCTVTYAWWVGGISANRLVIQSANISSKLTITKGVDFNFDGNLDKNNGVDIYENPEYVEGEDNKVLLKMEDVIPTEIYTWKVKAENKGDANGYFVISVSEDADKYYEYLSIFVITVDNVSEKVYLGKSSDILYGDKEYIAKGNGVKEYVFKLQLETFENLVTAGVFEDTLENREAYQALQGEKINTLLLDVTLTTEKPQ